MREWAAVQELAQAPQEPRLGCSTVSHEHLGFCAFCTLWGKLNAPNGTDLELAAWRLLALKKEEP